MAKKVSKRKKTATLKTRVLVLEAKVAELQSGDAGMHSLLMTLNQSNINSWAVLRQLKSDFESYVSRNPGSPVVAQ